MPFQHTTLRAISESDREETMSVTLKQRTYCDAEGRACAEGPAARFLVGPEGARVSDETAISLGLVDGLLPDSPKGKERKERQDKSRGPQEDKTGRRTPNQGRPLGSPAPKKVDRGARLKGILQAMVAEAKAGGKKVLEKLFTKEGKPDIRVISSRMEEQISGPERDEAWAEMESGAPPDAGGDGEGSDPKAPPSPDASKKQPEE